MYFQNGGQSGQLVFPVGRILTIADLQVAPILPSKFRVNWPFRSEVKNGGSCGHLGLPILTILAIFNLQVTTILPNKF